MCTANQLNSISKKIAESYQRVYGDQIVDIILYGSYARGNFDSESDIDITAIVKGNREELQRKLREVWDDSVTISLEQDVIISPTVIPVDEYEKYKFELPYYRNIMMEGKHIERFD